MRPVQIPRPGGGYFKVKDSGYGNGSVSITDQSGYGVHHPDDRAYVIRELAKLAQGGQKPQSGQCAYEDAISRTIAKSTAISLEVRKRK